MTSEPLIHLVPDNELDPLIQAFLDDCRLARLAPRTIEYYHDNLFRFSWWCQTFNIPLDPQSHTKGHIRQFMRYVQSPEARWSDPTHSRASRPAGASTQHSYFRVLRRFYNWLVAEERYLDESPMATMRAPKLPDEQPDPFSADELARIVAALDIDQSSLAFRNRAIVAILLDIGLRVSELCNLTTDTVDISTGDVNVIMGKGRKSRSLRIGASARRVVRRYWLMDRRHQPPGAFLLTIHERPMTQNSVKLMLNRVGSRADVKPINPHRFRHTAAVSAIRAGMNLFLVQQMLGHATLDMTRKYAKLVDADMSEAAVEHSALDHLHLNL